MGTEFTDEKLKQVLMVIVCAYFDEGNKKSIKKNSHMNEYKGTRFDEVKAKRMLEDFVALAIPRLKKDSPTTGDIVFGIAKTIPIFLDTVPYKLTKVVKEAVLVDFTNFVGFSWCIDFGMYTKDIEKERSCGEPEPRKALTEQEVFKSLGEGRVVTKKIWSTHGKDWITENSYFFKDGKLHMIQKYEDSEDFHNFPINHDFKQNEFVKYEDM